MQSISEILRIPEKKKGSERNSILKQIYEIYENDPVRKMENWKRFHQWCRTHSKRTLIKEHQDLFRKDRNFIKTLSPKQIAIKLAHIPTKDLYYMLSQVKDRSNRGESVGGYLLGSIKVKQDV